MTLAVVSGAATYTETVDGITWTYTVANGEASVGGGLLSSTAVPVSTSGAIVIPSSLGGYTVTSIGSYAFDNCQKLTNVTIPNGVTSISNGAFRDCRGLTNVTIPDSVTSIGDRAFAYCSCLTSVTIPDGVTRIGNFTFYNCQKMTNVTIPNGVTSIGEDAFWGCSSLTSVTIPDGVTRIRDAAFSGCSGLTRVTIPDSVTSIESSAFYGCSGLMSVTIPDSVISIGPYVFCDCTKLTNLTIPDGVTSIGNGAFRDCSGLTNVCVDDLPAWCRISFSGFYANPLYYAHRLYVKGVLATDLTIPEGVTNIENYVFCGCRSLTSVTIPDSATGIGDSAFSNCSSLMNVTISDSVTDVGEKAFYGCRCLMSVTIPDRVTYIGTSAFAMCSNMISVVLSENLTGIESSVFSNCCSLTSVVIPDCVTNIGRMAFSMCNSLTNVTLGSGVGIITDLAFNGCRGLTSLPIPNSVKHIGYGAFSGCSGLTSLTIPNSVTYIGYGAFSGCSALVEITLPFVGVRRGHSGDITSLFGYVFGMGSYSGGAGVLQYSVNSEGVDSWDTFYIPATLRKLVLTDETVLGSWALQNCRSLTDVTIPDSVTSIGTAPFYGCYGLSNVTVPQSVCTRGMKSVFAPSIYKQLSHVVVADGVLSIESSAFEDCYGLVSITIPGSVTTIGTSAFNNCTNTLLEVNSDCQVYVRQGSTGWGVTIPGEWAGIVIDYIDQIVVFDANGGEGSISNVLDRGTAIVAPTATRTGYTFKGWLPNVDYMVPASNVTYTAQWTPNKYHVTFDANGGTGGWSREMDCDAPINGPTVRKTGYAFNGWLPDVDYAVPASNVTYTAQWVPNQYTVTFNANDGEGDMTVKQDYGTAIVAPTVIRTGYTFKGWLPSVAATVPASNVTYKAQWMINRYTVTFDANGGTCGTGVITIDHGAAAGDLPVPTRVNDTFLGWFTAAEGGEKVDSSLIVTEGMTLYAHWLTLKESLDVGEGVAFANSEGVHWRAILDPSAKVGDATARSGEIGDRTNTWLSATVSGAGTMSFWCKVSCEHDDDNTFTWDRLMVYTNDVEVVEWRMDGETDWTRREVSFAGGENTVKWVYFKDRSISEGEDCAWVDGVTWTLADVAVDVGGGKSVLVPMDWIDAHSNIVIAVGGDKSAAMKSTAANGRKVWECYVLGLDPEKTGDFKITSFPMKADGTPDLSAITFEPAQSRWNLSGATPKLKGKATLDAEWQDVPPGGNPSFRFFTVEVQMP